MSIQKNQEYIVDIIDNGFEGEGIAKIDNFTIFIPGTIKGEKVRVLIVKVLSSHGFGKVIEILEKSQARQDVDCNTYKRCGGCNLRHVKYEETLKMKQNAVQSLVNKTLKNKVQVKNTIGMENPLHYRNKAQYPIGMNKENKPVIGVFARRSHEIIPINNCLIQKPISEQIAKFILEYITKNNISVYDEKSGKGIFRHLVIKVGVKTNEVMCILVINAHSFKNENKLVEELSILNINIPEEVTGFKITKQGELPFQSTYVKKQDGKYYLEGIMVEKRNNDETTDVFAINDKKVSITYLTTDRTDYILYNKHLNKA